MKRYGVYIEVLPAADDENDAKRQVFDALERAGLDYHTYNLDVVDPEENVSEERE